jgi:hypothetical protein
VIKGGSAKIIEQIVRFQVNNLLTKAFAACVLSALLLAGARAGVGGFMNETAGGKVAAGRAVRTGAWGGEHISLEVTDGGATAEFDCGRAVIPHALKLDRRGRFDVGGTYHEERGGPVRQGAQDAAHPARFAGRVRGGEMRLTVTLTDEKEIIGSFTLVHGREPSLVKCR